MALNEKSRLFTPVALESASQAIMWTSGCPDGSEAPQSDAAKASVYLSTDQTTDQSPVYVKVDNANSDDDWARVPVNKDESPYTMENNWTWSTDNQVQFRDSGLYLYSPADGDLQATVDGQFIVSGGSGLRLASTARSYEYITLTPDQFNLAMSASLTSGCLRHTSSGSYPAINFEGAGDLIAYGPHMKVPANAASSGSVRAFVGWAACTDGDAAVFRVGYDYLASGEIPHTTTGSYIAAASCVGASAITSSSIADMPSFTAGEFFAIRLEHVGTSGSDDSGSTTDVSNVVLRYMVDRIGEQT